MKRSSLILTCVLAIFIGVPRLVYAQLSEIERWIAPLKNEYRIEANVTYHVVNNYEVKLDVFVPRDATTLHPTVILIHGGSWRSLSKEHHFLDLLPYLARGWAVVNVEYRLADVALAPGAVEDCRCALWWVLRNAEAYKFDPEKIVITGTSAGGHLALTTGMLPISAGFDWHCRLTENLLNLDTYTTPLNQTRPKVAAIINWYGITDVVDLMEGPNQKLFALQWLGSQRDAEAIAKDVSPLTYVELGLPPILTIHGDADPVVPYSHAVRLHEALTKAGVPNQLITIPQGGHGKFSEQEMIQVYEAIWSFLTRHEVLSKADE